MKSIKTIAVLVASVLVFDVVSATQAVKYTYDALGRLQEVKVLSGPGSGVIQAYTMDAVGNRTLHQVTVPGQTTVTLTVQNATVNVTGAGVTVSVNIAGSSPGGTVTFTENGTFLGVASVVNGQAAIILQGYPAGSHSITATYSGDGTNAPQVSTFTIKVQDLRWLPAVLNLLLSN